MIYYLVYISGPISQGDQRANVRRATEAFKEIRRRGMAAVCPHWSWLAEQEFPELVGGITHASWMETDLPQVARCNAVLRLPGESKGGDMECKLAREKGIPVFWSMEDLTEHFVKFIRGQSR